MTDHKPLCYPLNKSYDRHSPREARQLDYISQFTTDIQSIKGYSKILADASSRMNINMLAHKQDIKLETAAQLQVDDAELNICKEKSNFILKSVLIIFSESSIIRDVSTGEHGSIYLGECAS